KTNLDKLNMSENTKCKLINEAEKSYRTSIRKLSFIIFPAAASVLALIIMFTGIFNHGFSKVYADDLMKGVTPHKAESVSLSEDFLKSTSDFSIELFKKSYTKGKNSLISPASVYLALGMTANGADGNTLKEFEAVLGRHNLNINDLNTFYNSLTRELTDATSEKFSIANSIWYRQNENLDIKKDFLQTNADYYGAAAYKADFNSKSTINDINNWVKNNTHNQIDKIIDQIDSNTIMYLINTVYFEDEWEIPYTKNDVRKAPFKLQDGTNKTTEFMHSEEYGYLKDDKAEGFIKPYKNGKYSFAALLPDEGVNIDSFISSLSGEDFINLLKNKSNETVSADLPKFKADYKMELNDTLKQMGLKDCFISGSANFSKMAAGNAGEIYLSNVLHKTFIAVDTKGTKAGAVTKVEMTCKGIASSQHNITLNRPFVYAIVDNKTNLPLFIGTMTNP
ncbi:MAG: serpin family protein, partial [Bacillota bacterium]|nr:serpin family protein [Bacillota bacterium]